MSLTDQQILDLSRREAAPWAERAQALAAAQVERQLPMLGELAEMGLEVARAIERAARVWTPSAAAHHAVHSPAAHSPVAQSPAPGSVQEPVQDLRIADPGAEPGETDAAIDEPEPRAERAAGIEGLALAYARVSRSVRLTIALQSKLVKDLEALHKTEDYRAGWKARQARSARKDEAARAVQSLAYAEKPDQERADAFHKAALGWLESDRYADLLDRPMSEVVAQLCKDVGATPDWSRLSGDAWARAEIASGKPGAPLRAFLAGQAQAAGREAPPDDADNAPGQRFRHARWRSRRRSQLHAGSP